MDLMSMLIIAVSFAAMWGLSRLDARFNWHLINAGAKDSEAGWRQTIATSQPACSKAKAAAGNDQQTAHIQALEARIITLETLVTSQAYELNQKINNL